MRAFSTAARTCAKDAIGWVASGCPVAGLMTVIERRRALGFFGDDFLVGLFFGVTRDPPTRCHGVRAQYPLRASTPYGWTSCAAHLRLGASHGGCCDDPILSPDARVIDRRASHAHPPSGSRG